MHHCEGQNGSLLEDEFSDGRLRGAGVGGTPAGALYSVS